MNHEDYVMMNGLQLTVSRRVQRRKYSFSRFWDCPEDVARIGSDSNIDCNCPKTDEEGYSSLFVVGFGLE
jgi:hypothetical protein